MPCRCLPPASALRPAILVASQGALTAVKWAGAAYLLWMGIRLWRRPKNTQAGQAAPTARLRILWFQGFVTSAANPKAVVFFAALFPQFISADRPLAPQLLILSLTYLAIDGSFLASYGAGASWLARRLKGRATAWLDRIGATFLIGAALMLGLKTLREAR